MLGKFGTGCCQVEHCKAHIDRHRSLDKAQKPQLSMLACSHLVAFQHSSLPQKQHEPLLMNWISASTCNRQLLLSEKWETAKVTGDRMTHLVLTIAKYLQQIQRFVTCSMVRHTCTATTHHHKTCPSSGLSQSCKQHGYMQGHCDRKQAHWLK